MYVLIDDEAEQ